MILRALLVKGALLLLGACAAAPETFSLPKDQIEAARRDQLEYMDSFLNFVRLSSADAETDQLTFLVNISFRGDLAITLYNHRETEAERGGDPVTMIVVFHNELADTYEKENGVVKTSHRVERYVVPLTREEFETAAKPLRSSEFRRQPFTDAAAHSCVDGTVYFIESVFEDGVHTIARHDCDETYSTLAAYAEPLLDLAEQYVPDLEPRFSFIREELGN